MTDYWSRAPFISHDGPDSEGVRAEVKVTLGFAIPKTIEPSGKGKAAKVVFPVDNTKWPSSGWAPVDSDIMKIVQEAHDNDQPINFRIETIRKPGVDRKTSISELTKGSDAARENANKSLAAVKREDDDEWTISSRAMTRLDEDPNDEGGTSAYSHSLESLQGANKTSAAGEAAPVEPLVDDEGNPNLGSEKLLVLAELFVALKNNAENNGVSLDSNTLRSLSKTAFAVANRLQVARGGVESPDPSLASHTQAVNAVKLTVEAVAPVTEKVSDAEGQKEWAGELLKGTVAFWTWSASEVTKLV